MRKDIDMNGFKNLVNYWGAVENIPEEDLFFVQDKVWFALDDKTKWAIVPIVEKYWRKEGFPYPIFNIDEVTKEYDKLLNLNVDKLFIRDTKELMQNNVGLNTVNCLHPHKYSVKCKSYRSPMATFENEKRFCHAIFKTMTFSGNPYRRTGLRNMIGIYSGTHAVSNFRPTIAKYIYTKYCPVGGRVLDPSMGYSGRLFGALSSHVGHYEGCDPCVATFKGNQKLVETIKTIEDSRNSLSFFIDDGEQKGRQADTLLHNIPFEEYEGEENSFDLVFTSPPFYDIEQYSNEKTQSWKKFSTYELWVEGFLRPLIITSHRVLKKGGNFLLNIYGTTYYKQMEEDTLRIAKEVFGHGVDDTIFMLLSKLMGIKNQGSIENRNNRFDHKVEPIFLFKK